MPEKYHAIAATGYRRSGDEVEGQWPIYPEMAAAGLWTTPSQLIRYASEIQRIHRSGKNGILTAESVRSMLTPGENGHGLGPVVSEYTFGHGGADEGFRAMLVAWISSPNAIVAMVNSDNDTILSEFVRAVAAEYGLPGQSPTIKTVADLTAAELARYAGTYEHPFLGEITAKVETSRLVLTTDAFPDPIILLPESGESFFNRETGLEYTFEFEADVVVGFEVRSTQATKIR